MKSVQNHQTNPSESAAGSSNQKDDDKRNEEEEKTEVVLNDFDDDLATIFKPCTPRITPNMSFKSVENVEQVRDQSITMYNNPYLPSPTPSFRSEPLSLFLQALSRVEENAVSLAVLGRFFQRWNPSNNVNTLYNPANTLKSPYHGDLPAPESLMSAPPSYSFVLRQIAARRRHRMFGNFVASPSYVQHTPPPNYTAAYDIYFDNPISLRASRVVPFGFLPMQVICPECGYSGYTMIRSRITICTHICACILCMFCCIPCVPLPYILRSCKDVYHYCRNCRTYLGMYCPTSTNPTFYHVPSI